MRRLLVGAVLFVAPAFFAWGDDQGSLKGRVTDPTGGTVSGADLSVSGPAGAKSARTDAHGAYVVEGLQPGTYTLIVSKNGFEPYGNGSVVITAGTQTNLDVRLDLAAVKENVTVTSQAPTLSIEPENNAGAIVIKGEDLDALPDDPDEMSDALQALAGPSAGPNGGQIFIDGFTGGRMPPKSSIREIRINANPFSAEYDHIGFGRIEIFTKPGTDQLRGEASYRFNNQDLNTMNPFVPTKPPYSRNDVSANLAGPIVAKKASFFIDFDWRSVNDNQIVNATTLDPTDLAVVPIHAGYVTPQKRTTVSPRVDWQINPIHSLTARYTYTTTTLDDAGIGAFSLASRGYTTGDTQHTIQLVETAAHGKSVSETRLQYWTETNTQTGDSLPTLQVQDAFTGGGAQVGDSSHLQDRFELQHFTSWVNGKHNFKAGFRLRTVHIDDVAEQGFAGTVVFGGGFAPELNSNNQVVLGPDGLPILVPIDSLERYRRTLLFGSEGLSPAAIRALGGGPSQLQIVGGSPGASVSQWDAAPFIQDDIHVTQDLIVSAGLRYEVQDNIHSDLNLAPRAGFSWSVGPKTPQGQAKTVIRGGFGIFYDRFSENETLMFHRYNGLTQQDYIVSDPEVLDQIGFDSVGAPLSIPSAATLAAFAQPQTTWRAAPGLQTPYTLQYALGAERQIPGNFTVSLNFLAGQGRRQLRAINANAPLPDGTTPLGEAAGNVYEVESNGHLNQYQWILGVNNRLNPKLTLFARYFLAWARSDTDGANSFPADSYDLAQEYGRAAIDVRHRVVLGGNVNLPWDVRVSPFLVASTGRPFNITVGQDLNGDSLFTDRPSFASSPNEPGVIQTAYGLLNPSPLPGEVIIPRNYGQGPGFVMLNLRLSKTIKIGRQPGTTDTPQGGPGGGPGGFGGRGGPGGGQGGRGGPQGLTISIYAQNLFNHVNLAPPDGNLSSPLFGQSLATVAGFGYGGGGSAAAGNRRIELQARLGF